MTKGKREKKMQAKEIRMSISETRSLMLVTALSPVIGYDKAAAIAHKAQRRI